MSRKSNVGTTARGRGGVEGGVVGEALLQLMPLVRGGRSVPQIAERYDGKGVRRWVYAAKGTFVMQRCSG